MSCDWIKMRVDIHDQPEVIGIANQTGLDADAVVGKLVRIWGWADRVTEDGYIPHVDRGHLDKLVGKKGFASALASVGWLDDDGGIIVIPNFDRHNGESAKKRARAMNRQQKHRSAVTLPSRSERDKSVTEALPEKRREEKRQIQDPPTPRPVSPESAELAQLWAFHCTRRRSGGLPADVAQEKAEEFAEAIRLGLSATHIRDAILDPGRNRNEHLWQFWKRISPKGAPADALAGIREFLERGEQR